MASSWSSSGDIELSEWLLPGERIHWIGKSARPELPWGRVIGSVLGVSVFGALGLAFFVHSASGTPGVLFAALVLAFYLGAVVYGVWAAKRDKVSNRYVLTDRRAAVFRVPNRLVGQVAVQGDEFEVVHRSNAAVGTLRWGISDPLPGTARWGGSSLFTMVGPLLGGTRAERVEFTDAGDFGRLMGQAAAVRAAWGASMPDETAQKRRGAAPGPLGFLDTRGAGIINRFALVIGSIALVAAVVLLLLTLVGGAPWFDMGVVAPLFVLIFPLFFWAVLMASQGRQQRRGEPLLQAGTRSGRRRPQRLPLEYLPMSALVAVGVLVVAAWISMALVFSSKALPGQPAYNPVTHSYTADNHGELIPLTESQFNTATKAQSRLFLSGTVAFITLAVAMAADETIRRRRSPYVEGHRPSA